MATSGRRGLPRPSKAASDWLNAPRPSDVDRGAYMELAWEQNRIMGSPGFPRDEAGVKARAGALYDRAWYPAGHGAIFSPASLPATAAAPRSAAFRRRRWSSTAPKIRWCRWGRARMSRNAIPGARMVVIDGMGHDIPDGAAPTVVRAVAENARRAA